MSKITTLSGLIGTNGDLTVDTDTLYVDSTNNRVGIGTSSPEHALSVFKDSSGNRTEIGIDNTDQRLVLGAYFETGVGQYSTIQSTDNAESSSTSLVLQPDGGNVGINSTTTSSLLTVGNSNDYTLGSTSGDVKNALDLIYDTTNSDYLRFYAKRESNGSTWEQAKHVIERQVDATKMGQIKFGSHTVDPISFGSNNSEFARFDGSGNLGIGTISPSVQLETNSNGFGHKIEGVSASNYSIHRLITDTSDDSKFIIGYGASHSTNPHQIALKAGNAAGTVGLYTAGVEGARLLSNRDFHVDGNVVAYSTTISDKRLKKDIVPMDNALWRVSQLNGCTFTYLKDDRKSAGLIAQDLEKVLPSAVIEDKPVFHGEEGETYKTVQYDQVIGLLVEAVKELKAEIEELKNGSSN
jgi:hypothetical protein